MKIYVVLPANYEYNDEYYNHEGWSEPLSPAYKSKEKAALALYELREKGETITDYDFKEVPVEFKIVELEVNESEVE